jgi:hypothetical protein
MTDSSILDQILKELKRTKKKHRWPVHVVAQAAIVSEEAGELIREALRYKYELSENDEEAIKRMEKEAIQTAVVAIRFIENLRK